MILILCLQAKHKHASMAIKSVCPTKEGTFHKGY